MTPIQIPADWDDSSIILFEEFCELIHMPQRVVSDWRRRGIGPHWTRFQGVGRLYITAGEARRYLRAATPPQPSLTSDTARSDA